MTNRSCFSIGTSPRMRGKPIPPHALNVSSRNIPAYAGKTLLSWLVSILNAEHPRVCGENVTTWLCSSVAAGTSPRMRGKLAVRCSRSCTGRNIPAYAGKTRASRSCDTGDTEHPRVCGENAVSFMLMPSGSGTSPRMRGKRQGAVLVVG